MFPGDALDARIRQYYCSLSSDVPRELLTALRRARRAQHVPQDEAKIDRIRPGGPPHVRMRSPVPEVSGTEPSHRALAARAPLGMAYHVEAGLPFRRECVAACTL